jgi:hypothetical protein
MMASTARRCKQCGSRVRGRGVFLFQTPSGPAIVCNRRCYTAWNDGPDVGPAEEERRPPVPRRLDCRRRRRAGARVS